MMLSRPAGQSSSGLTTKPELQQAAGGEHNKTAM